MFYGRSFRGWLGRLVGGAPPEIPDHGVDLLGGEDAVRDRRQLIIGVDFGTAYTKVVVGSATDDYVVPIGGSESEAGPYLLLGEGTFLESGECRLGEHPGRTVSDLKMRLITGERSTSVILDTVCFIALIFRRARLWMLAEHHRELRGCKIDWVVNVGLPTEGYEDTRLHSVYTDIARAAWILSSTPGAVRLDGAVSVMRQLRQSSSGMGTPCRAEINVFPEFAAQVAGYISNPAVRRSGLHLLVDIGAGTVDNTVFNVYEKDDEEIHPIFAKSVQPYGARFLVRHRLEKAGYHRECKVDEVGELPERAEFARLLRLSESDLVDIDNPFMADVREVIAGDLRVTKIKRYPTAPEWKSGVRTFITGGGSRMTVYREILNMINSGSSPIPLEVVDLPELRHLRWPLADRIAFDRLVVAYGLARDPDDIGRVIPSKDVEDIDDRGPGSTEELLDRFIDKDQV